MSKCRLSCEGVSFSIDLNVERFESPMQTEMQGGQTQEGIHYFPHKAYMQELQMEVVFRSEEEFTQFQDFVRASHKWAVRTVQNPEVTLYWPERGMDNWTGLIVNFQAGVTRFEFAPRSTIRIKLVDSLLSEKTWASSFGDDFRKFFETDIGYDQQDDFVPPPASAQNPPQGGQGAPNPGSPYTGPGGIEWNRPTPNTDDGYFEPPKLPVPPNWNTR